MTYAKWPALAAALTLALGTAWATTADAQTQQRQQAPQQRQQAPAQSQDFSSQELKTYASARLEVRRINQAYQPKLQSAQSEEQQQKLNAQAIEEMKSAIRDKGLKVQKYNNISMAMRADPALASKVKNHMAQLQ